MKPFPTIRKSTSESKTMGWVIQAAVLVICMLGYAAVFPWLYARYGDAARIVTAAFVLPAAIGGGLWTGLAVAVLTLLLDICLNLRHGAVFNSGILGPAIMFLVVAAVGYWRDLSRALKRELRFRAAAEQALAENEEKYRQIVEGVGDGILLVETETGRLLEANQALLTMTGHTRTSFSRCCFADLFPKPEHAEGLLCAAPEGRPLYYLNKRDGSSFPAALCIRRGVHAERPCTVVLVQDMSARVSAEKERKQFERMIGKTHRMEAIGALAGGISHDFNNILGAILGYADLIEIQGTPLSDKQRAHLGQIQKAARRARDLVLQILTFSRQSEAEKKPVMVGRILKEVVGLVRASIPSTIALELILSAERDTVIADPVQIHQVVMNLCTNAAQAIGDAPGSITVIASNAQVDPAVVLRFPDLVVGPYLKIEVRDTGGGIPPDVRSRIFEPYFTTKGKQGTGLGLSVVHGIVRDHNGTITVDSHMGKGAAFQVLLPLSEKMGPQEEIALPPAPIRGSGRILVVDDEPVLVRMMGELLSDMGYHVDERTSSLEAFKLFKAKPHFFDAVISDITMPGMTGIALGKAMFEVAPETPIILCTGFSEHMDEAQAQRIGFRKLLMKPVSALDLSAALRDVLHVLPEKGAAG